MKNYEDIAERVFKKGDAILEKKHRRIAFIKKTSFAVSGLCAVIITGLGIWNNNYLKNAIYTETPDIIDNQEISENDMPVTTQISNSETEKISTTVSTSAVFSLQTTVSDDLFQDNDIIITTSSGEISPFSINNHSEEVQKTTISTAKQTTTNTTKQTNINATKQMTTNTTEQTTINTTKQTITNTMKQTITNTTKQTTTNTTKQTTINTTKQTITNTTKQTTTNMTKQTTTNTIKQTTISTTTQTVIMTETTDTSQNIEDERSLNMKKLASFASALTISLSTMPTISNASGVPFSVNPVRYWAGEDTIFSAMESGELDVDINGNGEFDIMDCYLLDSYCSQYYSYKENIDPEIIQRIESIADYNRDGKVDFEDTLKIMRYFIVDGNIKAEYLNPAFYDPDLEPLTTEEQLINFGDYKEIQAYCFPMRMYYHVMYLEAEYYLIDELYQNGTVDLDFNGNGQLDIDDIYCVDIYSKEKDSEVLHQLLTDEEYERCDSFYYHFSEHLVPYHCSQSMYVKIASYILNHIDINQEYFTIAYCKENIEDYRAEYYLPSLLSAAATQIGIEVSDDIGPSRDIQTSRELFLKIDVFNPFYEKYCSDIKNGVLPAPDVDKNGVVDYNDYFAMNIYWNDVVTGKEDPKRSILPVEVWNTIDGYYGVVDEEDDMPILYELTAAQLYIMENTEEIADIDGAYDKYVENLVQAKRDGVKPLYNENVAVLDEERSGDANEDGETNISDAVFIMQSLSNPSQYTMTEQGAYNADVCNTGDGVTAMDALQIQLWTIGL